MAVVAACFLFGGRALAQGAEKPVLVPQTGHTATVSSVAFSPDGKTLASGSGDNTVILWDVSAEKQLATLHMPTLRLPIDPPVSRLF